MNNDLISRSALLEDINFDRRAAKVHPQEICERFERFCDYAETLVEETPAVDAEVVRHAYWHELLGCGYTVCSACDFIPYTVADKYCPNCGAKMDGEQNDIQRV